MGCMTMGPVSQEPRDYQLTIRIPRRIRAALKAQAEHEHRSVADVVNNILAGRFPAPLAPTKRSRRR
jgi:predicted HicB family RNase H-like nuclease